jgi:hypothetical protein
MPGQARAFSLFSKSPSQNLELAWGLSQPALAQTFRLIENEFYRMCPNNWPYDEQASRKSGSIRILLPE